MKWLKDDSYNAMKQAADNWDKLLNKVLGDNPDMKAEDVTVDQLLKPNIMWCKSEVLPVLSIESSS